jgi:hypothetical protein
MLNRIKQLCTTPLAKAQDSRKIPDTAHNNEYETRRVLATHTELQITSGNEGK